MKTFEGLRVLDFSAMIAGPHCARLLADHGAEVVKLEPPEGDYMRSRGPMQGGYSRYYGTLNTGKKSVCIDLKKPAAKALVLELADKADVVVENFRPGVMKRLGFDYATLSKRNPKLVYCSISGYGQEGSFSQRPAYAPIVHAASGFELANLHYQDGLERPLKSGIFIADILSGVNGFAGVSAALYRRATTGQGEYVDVTLMDTMLGLMPYECQEAQFPQPERRPLYRPTKCADGFVILAPISQANFEDLARAAGHAEWIADPRFSENAERGKNWDALMDLLDDWAKDKRAEDCERVMREGGVPCSRYNTVQEAIATPYIEERGTFTRAKDAGGEFLAPNPAFRLTQSGNATAPWVDGLGAHNAEVLKAWLGRDAAAIAQLEKEKVLCRAS